MYSAGRFGPGRKSSTCIFVTICVPPYQISPVRPLFLLRGEEVPDDSVNRRPPPPMSWRGRFGITSHIQYGVGRVMRSLPKPCVVRYRAPYCCVFGAHSITICDRDGGMGVMATTSIACTCDIPIWEALNGTDPTVLMARGSTSGRFSST